MTPEDADKIIGKIHSELLEWQALRADPILLTHSIINLGPEEGDRLVSSPSSRTGLMLREDSLTELFAGNTRVILDGEGRSLYVSPEAMVLISKKIRLMAQEIRLGEGDGVVLNPQLWKQGTSPNIVSPGPLFDTPELKIVCGEGVPQAGQVGVPLKDIFGSVAFVTEPTTEVSANDWVSSALDRIKK